MGVVNFRGRSYHRSTGCIGRGVDDSGHCCPVCDWGAFICTSCGSAEGEVPTDCPRHEMSSLEKDKVMQGRLDYIVAEGGWVGYDSVVTSRPRTVPVCTAVEGQTFDQLRLYQDGAD